jgi:hypothetical protein
MRLNQNCLQLLHITIRECKVFLESRSVQEKVALMLGGIGIHLICLLRVCFISNTQLDVLIEDLFRGASVSVGS